MATSRGPHRSSRRLPCLPLSFGVILVACTDEQDGYVGVEAARTVARQCLHMTCEDGEAVVESFASRQRSMIGQRRSKAFPLGMGAEIQSQVGLDRPQLAQLLDIIGISVAESAQGDDRLGAFESSMRTASTSPP